MWSQRLSGQALVELERVSLRVGKCNRMSVDLERRVFSTNEHEILSFIS